MGWLVHNPVNMSHGEKIIVIIFAWQSVRFRTESNMYDILNTVFIALLKKDSKLVVDIQWNKLHGFDSLLIK